MARGPRVRLRRLLPPHRVPAVIVKVHRIPQLPNGKSDERTAARFASTSSNFSGTQSTADGIATRETGSL